MSASLPPDMAPPSSSELDSDEPLLRARELIVRAIRRRWSTGLLSRDPDGVFTAFLGSEQIERLMTDNRPSGAEIRDAASERPAASPESYLGRFAQRLRLGPSQLDLLCVLLAIEID